MPGLVNMKYLILFQIDKYLLGRAKHSEMSTIQVYLDKFVERRLLRTVYLQDIIACSILGRLMMVLRVALVGPALFDPGNFLPGIIFQVVHHIVDIIVRNITAGLIGENGAGFPGGIKDQIFFDLAIFHYDTTPFLKFSLDGAWNRQ